MKSKNLLLATNFESWLTMLSVLIAVFSVLVVAIVWATRNCQTVNVGSRTEAELGALARACTISFPDMATKPHAELCAALAMTQSIAGSFDHKDNGQVTLPNKNMKSQECSDPPPDSIKLITAIGDSSAGNRADLFSIIYCQLAAKADSHCQLRTVTGGWLLGFGMFFAVLGFGAMHGGSSLHWGRRWAGLGLNPGRLTISPAMILIVIAAIQSGAGLALLSLMPKWNFVMPNTMEPKIQDVEDKPLEEISESIAILIEKYRPPLGYVREKCIEVPESIDIRFPHNKSQFDTLDSPELIKNIAHILPISAWHQGKLVVEGFADPVGTDVYNFQLSQKRADRVREILDKWIEKRYVCQDPANKACLTITQEADDMMKFKGEKRDPIQPDNLSKIRSVARGEGFVLHPDIRPNEQRRTAAILICEYGVEDSP